jgi:hypothetical protein
VEGLERVADPAQKGSLAIALGSGPLLGWLGSSAGEGRVDEQYEGSAEALSEYFVSGQGLSGFEVQPHLHDHGPADGTSTSVREFEHRDHHARIETTYRISIDGEPLTGHVEVLPSGRVHYHPFPQYAPESAVDVVKAVIDTIWEKPPVPDDLASPAGPEPPPGESHGHHGDHGGGAHRDSP